MKQRNIAICILLSFVTCGIYGLYWFATITDDLKAIGRDDKTASGGLALVFTIITCGIYGWYWAYKRGENIDYYKNAIGMPSSNTGILYIILQAVGLGIVAYALMQNEINNAYARNNIN